MKVVFRCDASNNIGTGHVRRCLTLADELKNSVSEIIFMSDDTLKGNLCSFIELQGYQYIKTEIKDIPKGTDLLVVDHYDIDYLWEQQARKYTQKIMVIDDLANRKHDCDLLLDQNLYADMEKRYEKLVPRNCKLMLGPEYALLREEFQIWRNKTAPRKKLEHLFINFGGSDPHSVTLKTLEAIKDYNLSADIVIGREDNQVINMCKDNKNWNLHINANNMAELMSKADLGICAGGSTIWERCALGLPSIVIAIADNQKEISQSVHNANACIYLGYFSDENIFDALKEKLEYCLANQNTLEQYSIAGQKLVNANGVSRVAEKIEQ